MLTRAARDAVAWQALWPSILETGPRELTIVVHKIPPRMREELGRAQAPCAARFQGTRPGRRPLEGPAARQTLACQTIIEQTDPGKRRAAFVPAVRLVF